MMKHGLLSKICALALCLALGLAWLPGRAEGCFVIDVDFLDMDALRSNDYVAENLSSHAPGIRIEKHISDSDELAARVRLTVLQVDTNTLIFDKNYGYQSKVFDSGDIYLPYVGNRTVPYLLTLYIEDWVFAMPFMHTTPRLFYNGACTYGVRFSDYNPALGNSWVMGTMVDLNELRYQGRMSVPICASNSFLVGEAQLSLTGELMTVSLGFAPEANVELHQSALYFVPRVAELTGADPAAMPPSAYYGLGEGIDVTGLSTGLLYLAMSISYDSAGLMQFSYDLQGDGGLQRQLALWNENLYQVVDLMPPIVMEPLPTEGEMLPEIPPTEMLPVLPPEMMPEIPPEILPDIPAGEAPFTEEPMGLPDAPIAEAPQG